MANSYTKAAFALTVTAGEANMLRLAERAVDILDTNGADEDLALGYDSLGTAFHALFPPKGTSMFESFLDLFDDWSFPYLDCRIDLSEPDANGPRRWPAAPPPVAPAVVTLPLAPPEEVNTPPMPRPPAAPAALDAPVTPPAPPVA